MHNAYRKNASYLIQWIKLGRKVANMAYKKNKNGRTNGRGGDQGPEEGR